MPLKPCDLSSVPRTHRKTQEPTPQVHTLRFLLTLPICHQVLTDEEKFTRAKQVSPEHQNKQGGRVVLHLGVDRKVGCWLLWFPLNASTATTAARCWFKFIWESSYFVTSTVSTNFLGSPASPRVPNSEPQTAHVVISHCFEGH